VRKPNTLFYFYFFEKVNASSSSGINREFAIRGSPITVHTGVTCNCCYSKVNGNRYKCSVCYDFDFCEKCELADGKHPKSHPMIKFKIPKSQSDIKNLKINIAPVDAAARSNSSVLLNSDHMVAKKGSSTSKNGGDTGLIPSKLYYCGRKMNECRCGKCDGICGPFTGCPCNACIGLIRNSDGIAVKKGWPTKKSGGDTGGRLSDIYYCGRKMNECRCGNCDGFCGPDNGCPCNSCLELIMN
jgi:hypothetical protein